METDLKASTTLMEQSRLPKFLPFQEPTSKRLKATCSTNNSTPLLFQQPPSRLANSCATSTLILQSLPQLSSTSFKTPSTALPGIQMESTSVSWATPSPPKLPSLQRLLGTATPSKSSLTNTSSMEPLSKFQLCQKQLLLVLLK